jgi:hypothetical protein
VLEQAVTSNSVVHFVVVDPAVVTARRQCAYGLHSCASIARLWAACDVCTNVSYYIRNISVL